MAIRLNKVIKEFNVGMQTVVDFLEKKGHKLEEVNPNTKLTDEQYSLVKKEFQTDEHLRNEAEKLRQTRQEEKRQEQRKKEKAKEERKKAVEIKTEIPQVGPKVVGKIDLEPKAATPAEQPKKEAPKAEKPAEEKKPEAAPAPKAEKPQPKAEQPEKKPAEAPATPAPKAEAKAEPQKKQKASVEERAREIGQVKDGVFELKSTPELQGPKVLGTIDLAAINASTRPKKKTKEERRKERENKQQNANGEKKKRNRIGGGQRVDINAAANQQGGGGNRNRNNNNNAKNNGNNQGGGKKNNRRGKAPVKQEVSDEDVAKQVRDTLARLTNKSKTNKGAKYRKEKREQVRAQEEELRREEKAESKVLKLTEFVTANELATMMDVPVTKVIATCMNIGMMVSINQRLEAETIDIVAEEFGYKTEYISAEVQDAVAEVEDAEEDLKPRAPIVTVMGHVDHGKTSLLDHIRNTNVIAGEAGGITQHIGAYSVTLKSGRKVTFLDTPGHEAFTAMRARGTQVTDIAIIIIAADDSVMPTTKEAIAHAQAAGVPMVFAINKIDKPGANPDKIREDLSQMNLLVEERGGKYQCQEISAKKGLGVADLLDKVLLEADMLDLKANPNRNATGTVIESSLDKGRGYVSTVLVSNGTLKVGDNMIAGTSWGRIKAMFNERNQRVEKAGPSEPVIILGLNGAPTAGDTFHVMETEQEARDIANKREQLQREQGLRTQTRLTLSDISHRIARGEFHEMNIIVKGDTDGSIEALADSFIKLSTEKVKVNVISKAV